MSLEELYAMRNVLSTDQYAFYLRKSRKDLELEALGEGETLAKHTKILEGLAAKYGVHPDQITVYKEIVSGESLMDRPQAQLLLDHVLQGRYKAVFVVEVERLARGNTRDQGEVAEAFQASHTKIITAQRIYDPDSEVDEEYFEFGLFMSRREYKTYQRRQKAGKEASVKDGNYLLPQRPMGYEIIRPSKKVRTLKPIPDEVKIVQMIFDWYTEDRRATSWIAKHLTLMGIQTMKNKPQWNRGTIRDMLANPIYIGKVTWNGSNIRKVFDPVTGRLKKTRTFNSEPEIYEGKHDGIISKEQFEKAQRVTLESKNPALPVSSELVNPLAGLMVCCACGRHVVAHRFKDKPTRISHARDTKCKKKSLLMDVVLATFEEGLLNNIADLEGQMKIDTHDEDWQRHETLLQSMRTELEKKEKQRARLFQDYEDEVYTRDEFIERKQVYNQAIEELKKQIQEAESSAPEPVNYADRIHNLHSMIECIRDPDLSAKKKNDFLKQFIDKITYDVVDFGHKKGGEPILEVFYK